MCDDEEGEVILEASPTPIALLKEAISILDDPFTKTGGRARIARYLKVSRQAVGSWVNNKARIPDSRAEQIRAAMPKIRKVKHPEI